MRGKGSRHCNGIGSPPAPVPILSVFPLSSPLAQPSKSNTSAKGQSSDHYVRALHVGPAALTYFESRLFIASEHTCLWLLNNSWEEVVHGNVTYLERRLFMAGMATPSPTPMQALMVSSTGNPNPAAMGVKAVAMDHQITPKLKTRLPPNLSAHTPPNTCVSK